MFSAATAVSLFLTLGPRQPTAIGLPQSAVSLPASFLSFSLSPLPHPRPLHLMVFFAIVEKTLHVQVRVPYSFIHVTTFHEFHDIVTSYVVAISTHLLPFPASF